MPSPPDSRPYQVRFFFEWRGGWLWCGDDYTRDAFDVGPIERKLPLSAATLAEGDALSAWHDTSLNWDDPAGPSLWSSEQSARFDAASRRFFHKIQQELGPAYEVVDEQGNLK